jgi:phage protein D
MNRWIEEGREEEEKAKAKPKVKSKTKPDYLKEINVLLDLLEDDTLTKEVFIKKMREKLK